MCIDTREAMTWWTLDPLSLGPIVLSSALYGTGVRRVWRHAGIGHGIQRWEVGAFAAGQLALLVALVSPVDRLSDLLFSAHMTQHEIIMVVAPPLIVLGRPFAALAWVWPAAAKLVPRTFSPFLAVTAHALAIWLWHVPRL